MNDLDLMEKFRADAGPADPAALRDARYRMFRPPTRRTVPWVWRLVPAATLAAVVATVAVVATRSAETPPAASPAASSEAAGILRLAAAEARREPLLRARPDQFVYVESLVAHGGVELGATSAANYRPPVENDRRVWLSVDGSRDGLLRQKPVKAEKPGKQPGEPDLRDVPLTDTSPGCPQGLPTDAKAMRAWLYEGTDGPQKEGGNTPDTTAFIKIGDTLREQYVPPASVSALFEAAATIGGTTVVKQVDLAGRRGTAVSLTNASGRHDLIFDATSYKFLGERDVTGQADPAVPAGTVIGWTAQLTVAIVDKPGQLP
jgi:hypothetical protein